MFPRKMGVSKFLGLHLNGYLKKLGTSPKKKMLESRSGAIRNLNLSVCSLLYKVPVSFFIFPPSLSLSLMNITGKSQRHPPKTSRKILAFLLLVLGRYQSGLPFIENSSDPLFSRTSECFLCLYLSTYI